MRTTRIVLLGIVLCVFITIAFAEEDFSYLDGMTLDQLIAVQNEVERRIDAFSAEETKESSSEGETPLDGSEAPGITFLGIPWGSSHETVSQYLQDCGFIDGPIGFGEHEIAVWPDSFRNGQNNFPRDLTGIGGRSIFLHPLKGIGGYEIFQVQLFYLYENQNDVIVPDSHLTMVRLGLQNPDSDDLVAKLNQTYGPYDKSYSPDLYIWYGENDTAVAVDNGALYYAKTNDYTIAEKLLSIKPEPEDAGL